LELLPRRSEGNSALEVIGALKQLGYYAKAYRLDPGEIAAIKQTVIVLSGALTERAEEPGRVGHYYVLRPISRTQVQVLDFPAYNPLILDRQSVAQTFERLASKSSVVCAFSRVSEPQLQDLVDTSIPVDLTPTVAVKPSAGATVEIDSFNDANPVSVAHKFGSAPPALLIRHTFKIRNSTPTALRIDKVVASCGCAAAKWDVTDVASGEVATISIDLDLRKKRGPLSEEVVIQLKQGDRPKTVRLRLGGHVEHPPDEQGASTRPVSG
jgi:hypothetical protein